MDNRIIRNTYDAFLRIGSFSRAHSSEFAPGSKGAVRFAELATITTEMEAAGVLKLSGKQRARGFTDAKEVDADGLWELLKRIATTARSIAVDADEPEFDDAFHLPRGRSHSQLIARAEAVKTALEVNPARFVEFGLPHPATAAALGDFITGLRAADDSQNTADQDAVSGTASLAALAANGMKPRAVLNGLIRNLYADQPGVLAEWRTAHHITRPQGGSGNGGETPPAN